MRASGRWAVWWLATIGVAALWVVATVPWGMRVRELLPFTGPGATLGLSVAWLAFAADPRAWSWRAGLWGALAGAAMLPPLLAFLIALAGTASTGALTPMFVAFSWIALGIGATAALLRFLLAPTRAPRRIARGWLSRAARRRHLGILSRGRFR